MHIIMAFLRRGFVFRAIQIRELNIRPSNGPNICKLVYLSAKIR